MRDVDEVGIRAVLTRILKGFKHLDKIHVSLDLDVMDPLDAPGVGTPSQGGLTYREGQLIMEILAETGKTPFRRYHGDQPHPRYPEPHRPDGGQPHLFALWQENPLKPLSTTPS